MNFIQLNYDSHDTSKCFKKYMLKLIFRTNFNSWRSHNFIKQQLCDFVQETSALKSQAFTMKVQKQCVCSNPNYALKISYCCKV